MCPLHAAPLSATSGSVDSTPASNQETLIPAPPHDGGLERMRPAAFDDASSVAGQVPSGRDPPLSASAVPDVARLRLHDGNTSSDGGSPSAAKLSPAGGLVAVPQTDAHLARRSGYEGKEAPYRQHPWAEKVMSPTMLFMRSNDQRVVLGLDRPGLELQGTSRGGDFDRVVLVKFRKDGPQGVELRWRDEVVAEERADEEAGEGNGKDAKL